MSFKNNVFLAIPTPIDSEWYRVEGFFTETPSEEMIAWFAARGRKLESCAKNDMGAYFVYMNIPVDRDALVDIKMRWAIEMYREPEPEPVKPSPPPYSGKSLWPDLSGLSVFSREP